MISVFTIRGRRNSIKSRKQAQVKLVVRYMEKYLLILIGVFAIERQPKFPYKAIYTQSNSWAIFTPLLVFWCYVIILVVYIIIVFDLPIM